MFPATDNPAQRLLEILRTSVSAPTNQTVAQLWATLFGLKQMDPPTFYRVGGHLNYLVDSIEIRIREIPDINHSLYLREMYILRNIVSPIGMQIPWDSIKGPLSTGALTALEFCANELGKTHAEENISREELLRLRQEFGQLLAEVSKSDLPTELKVILLDLLTSSLIAIDQYQILGNEGLKKAVAYSVGSITLHKKQFLASKSQVLVQKIVEKMHSLGITVGAAYKISELAHGVPELSHLLEGK